MSSAWLAVVAALGASAITAGASLGFVGLQERLRRRASDRRILIAAVTEMLSRSVAIMLRGQAIGLQMRLRSGLGEGADVMLRIRKPADILEFHDWLAADFAPMNRAWSVIWARGDQETVRLANQLLSTCSDLIGAATSQQPAATVGARLLRWATGEKMTPELEQDINRAVKDVAHAREQLAQRGRQVLRLPPVQLFGHDDTDPPGTPAVPAAHAPDGPAR